MKLRVSWALVMGLTLLGPAVGTSEATRDRDHSRPDTVLCELTEHAILQDALRLATSSLEGSARRGTPLCPEGLQAYAKAVFAPAIRVTIDPRCRVVAVGRSEIRLTDFGGHIGGKFWIVVNSDVTSLTDAQELVIMSGEFEGTVQVTDPQRLIDILPGSTFTPKWVLPGFDLPAAATFTGTFRLPFTVRHTAVYQNERGQLVPVLPNERALGNPTVRIEVDFD